MVSSTTLAEETQLLPIVIKKDLQAVGAPSKLRAGFKVAGTIAVIEKFLGWNNLNKALDGVNFEVAERECVSIIGKSGSGKSK